MFSLLHHRVLIRHISRDEEDRLRQVWTWNLYLIRLIKVCRLYLWILSLFSQIKRLQQEPYAFTLESPLTRLRSGRESREVHDESTFLNTTTSRF